MAGRAERNLRGRGRGKKLIEVWAWATDQKRIDYCKTCRKTKTDPPCGTGCSYAKGPALWKINADAWELWLEVQTQWRGGGMGIIGLDYNTVYAEAARIGIELSVCTMKKIKALEREVLRTLKTED